MTDRWIQSGKRPIAALIGPGDGKAAAHRLPDPMPRRTAVPGLSQARSRSN